MKILKYYAFFALSALLLLYACKRKKHPVSENIVPDSTITERTSFNNLFLDSTQIQNFLDDNESFEPYEDNFFAFYKERNYEYGWFDSTGMIEQVGNLIGMINNALNQNKDSSLYDKQLFAYYDKYKNAVKLRQATDLSNAELYFTGCFFKYISKAYNGSAELNATQLGWFIPRKKLDMTALLDETLKNDKNPDFTALLNPSYLKLKELLVRYQSIKAENPQWDSIRLDKPKLQLNDENPAIPAIKKRLAIFGDLADNDGTELFDDSLKNAVTAYQKRMGFATDGIVGKSFIRSINTPLDSLIRRILVNVERTRWLPSQLPETYAWVNIPEYRLHVYDVDSNFTMRVIVGSAAHNTVIFSGNLKYVVFAPYWNIPASIIQKEIWPGMKANPDYIASHNMKVTGYKKNGEPIVVQLPGPNNSLGRVKFLFPNDYDIYLHDTPNHDLFTSSNRSLSHGCIRLAQPEKMAQFLLRGQPAYTTEKIDSLMNKNLTETWVTIKPTVPVFLVYFTAWVDDDGKLNFRNDIYGHDKKVAAKLFK